MPEKIIENPSEKVCSRWKMDMNGHGECNASCLECLYCDGSEKDNKGHTLYKCKHNNGNPQLVTYKKISDPDNRVCHKFFPSERKTLQKYGVNKFKFLDFVKKLKKGIYVDKEKDKIPVCSVCTHSKDSGCRLRMKPARVTKKEGEKTKLMYDTKKITGS